MSQQSLLGPSERSAPTLDWRGMNASDHFVQFYEQDASLVEAVSGFITAGLETGESCIVIATQEHREEIETKLKARGLDLAAASVHGQLVLLDAAETLSEFMREGSPEPQRFQETVGRVIAQATQGGRCVRAFGEMVALLWSEGNQTAAIRLEELWNELAQSQIFCLFCAYSMESLGGEALAESFKQVCACHTKVIPAESYAALDSPNDRLKEISLLQQRAGSLEAEIAQRKEAEQALVRSERDLKDFLENALEGLHKVGPDGTILWANQAELELLGYPPEEYIGHHIAEFHVDREVIEEMVTQLLRGESLYNYPARLRCRDGSIKQVLVHSNACFEDGKFLYSRCFSRDVTQFKDAEIVQQRLAAIVDSSDDAIIGKTLEGIITSWNKGAEQIFGYTAAEAVGRPKTLVFPQDRLSEEDMILARLRRGERIEHFETVRIRKDGRQIDVSLTISPIKDGHGKIVGASTIARDITEFKQQRHELETLNARLRRSMTETHHRVKNNLQLMSALIEMQRQTDRDMVPMSELVRLGQNIQALGVIHDILTHEAKEDADATFISVQGVLEQLLSILQGTLGARRLLASLEEVSLPGKQTTSLALITNELISNAVKHGKGDVELTFRQEGDLLTLEVCDDGPGFSEGFDPETAAHTGLDLIENIARYDLRAETSYRNRKEGGARVAISFSLPRTHPDVKFL
ncbi:MAG: sensor protein [Chthonomonadales bacterium]|nr:sensor protein [Chthonomonadales bacterium]